MPDNIILKKIKYNTFFTIRLNCDIIITVIIMKYTGDSFVVLESDASDAARDSHSGWSATATKMSNLSGFDVMDKVVRPDGDAADNPDEWYNRQKYAARITDMLRAKNNPAYVVPRAFVSHGHVRDEFIAGKPVSDLSSKYRRKITKELTVPIGQFINDMSELFPMRKSHPTTFIDLPVKSVDELSRMMNECKISRDRQKIIREIFEYLRDLPENREMVFTHGDLNNSNMLFSENKPLGIIDFDQAGFHSMADIMYREFPSADIWKYVNGLQRTTNTDLHWNYNQDIFELYQFLQYSITEMSNAIQKCGFIRMCVAYASVEAMVMSIEEKYARLKRSRKLDAERMPTSLVPITHYNKGMDL